MLAGCDSEVTLDASDVTIGGVEIQDADSETRAKVGPAEDAVVGDNALTVSDPVAAAVLGAVDDAAVTTSVAGTLSAKLRGLVAIFADVWNDTLNALRVDGSIAHNAADAGNPVKIGGVYNTVAPTLDSGDRGDLQVDASSNLLVTLATEIAGEDVASDVLGVTIKPTIGSAYSGSRTATFGTDIDIAVKATAGCIKSVVVDSTNTAVRYLHIFNQTTAPAGGNVPVFSFKIPAGSATQPSFVEIGANFFGENGHYLSTGIAVGVSTANATFTAATAADHNLNITYV